MAAPFERALVIGATGLIGAHAVRACLEEAVAVRAVVREGATRRASGFGAPLPEGGGRGLLERVARDAALGARAPLPAATAPAQAHVPVAAVNSRAGILEFAGADLSDTGSLRRALEGCDLAIHAAAPYPRRHYGKRAFLEAAAHGMRNFLEACAAAGGGLRAVVYVSSITTIGCPAPGKEADEQDRERPPEDSPYFAVKAMMEDMALAAARGGLPLAVVNPTLCVDEYDDHRTTARLLIPLARGGLPAYIAGALNAVATRDVGRGVWLAAARGRPGERYILGGENLSTQEFLARCAAVAGAKPPRLALPLPLAEALAWKTEVLAWATRTTPLFPLSGIRMSKWSRPVSNAKARGELGFAPTSLDQAIARAYAWYRERGWLKPVA